MHKKWIQRILILLLLNSSYAQAATEVQTVPFVDVERYMGRWYEIAALPQFFERNCFGSRADYTLLDNGKVEVVNTCNWGAPDGKPYVVKGSAKIVDNESNAKLKVSFFWPFSGDYWVLDLADDYSVALVGSPNRKSLWVLSREPVLDETILQDLLDKAEAMGFPVEDVRLMPPAG